MTKGRYFMGKQRVIEKRDMRIVSPMQTITSLTPGNVTEGRNAGSLGVIPIGVYKGDAAFWDLDKAVNQPLVFAEQQHILGILDGREEDYDLQTLAVALNEPVGTVHTAQLVVPTDEVWYLNAVETVVPASGGGNTITANWRCSLWTDRSVTPNVNGQAFHPADYNPGAGGGTQWDEFGMICIAWAVDNKQSLLRLPASAVLTVTFTNTLVIAAAAVNCIFRVWGFVGKQLVA